MIFVVTIGVAGIPAFMHAAASRAHPLTTAQMQALVGAGCNSCATPAGEMGECQRCVDGTDYSYRYNCGSSSYHCTGGPAGSECYWTDHECGTAGQGCQMLNWKYEIGCPGEPDFTGPEDLTITGAIGTPCPT